MGVDGGRASWIRVLVCAALLWRCDEKKSHPDAAATDVQTPSTDPISYGPTAAAPCSPDGSVRECGRVYHTDGDYVYCSVGHSTCAGGKWGDCVGDHFVAKSAPGLRMSNAGLRFQALSGECTNACDPYCLQLQPVPEVTNSPGLVNADAGGVTLEWKEVTVTDLSN